MSTGIVSPSQITTACATSPLRHTIGQDATGFLDWLSAVAQIKQSLELVDDKDVAMMLDVPVSTFSEFRNSAGNLPWLAKLRLLHLMGYESISEALEMLSREESAEKSRRKLMRHARKTATQAPPRK